MKRALLIMKYIVSIALITLIFQHWTIGPAEATAILLSDSRLLSVSHGGSDTPASPFSPFDSTLSGGYDSYDPESGRAEHVFAYGHHYSEITPGHMEAEITLEYERWAIFGPAPEVNVTGFSRFWVDFKLLQPHYYTFTGSASASTPWEGLGAAIFALESPAPELHMFVGDLGGWNADFSDAINASGILAPGDYTLWAQSEVASGTDLQDNQGYAQLDFVLILNQVPEPATMLLLCPVLGMLWGFRRKFKG